MMTLDVSPEAWESVVFAAERELTHEFRHSDNISSFMRDKEDRQLIANSIRAALRVMQIDLTET